MSRRRLTRSRSSAPSAEKGFFLYTDGDQAFEAAHDAMQRARTRIWLETYVLEPDDVGRAAREALIAAATRGCSVVLLYDQFGSPHIDTAFVRPIIEAGGRAAAFNPVLPWARIGKRLAPILHRDHRKILIVDDTGFCGGANVSLDYGGPGPELFFDLTLQIDGPVVQDLAALLLETLRLATGQSLAIPPRPRALERGCTAQVLALSNRAGRRDLDIALENALDLARERCFIMTPYFVPPRWFVRAVVEAAGRGVDVRILTAGRSDVPLAKMAGRHLYGKMLRSGIRVFEMMHPVLHAKCLTIDGRYSVVGSYNVDVYGGRHNLEVGVATTAPDLAEQLADEFLLRASDALEIVLDEWLERPRPARLLEWLLHLLFRF